MSVLSKMLLEAFDYPRITSALSKAREIYEPQKYGFQFSVTKEIISKACSIRFRGKTIDFFDFMNIAEKIQSLNLSDATIDNLSSLHIFKSLDAFAKDLNDTKNEIQSIVDSKDLFFKAKIAGAAGFLFVGTGFKENGIDLEEAYKKHRLNIIVEYPKRVMIYAEVFSNAKADRFLRMVNSGEEKTYVIEDDGFEVILSSMEEGTHTIAIIEINVK